MRIALLTVVSSDCVATWKRFVHLAEKYFMPRGERHFFVLSDADWPTALAQNVTLCKISHREFAEIHLRRHQWCVALKDRLEGFDYAYFLPVFAEFQREIGADFLPNSSEQLVVVQHPRFVNIPADRMPLERDRRSQAFVRVGQGTQYVTSEIYGGTVSTFLKMSQTTHAAISTDAINGIAACRHLESHLNRYAIDHPITVRHAGYSYPEHWDLGVPKLIQMADGGISDRRRDWPGYRQTGLPEGVSIEICGDLGLQLTQYAVGRTIALKKGSRLWMDTRSCDENKNQPFGLGHFKINAEVGNQESLPSLSSNPFTRLFEPLWAGRRFKHVQLQEDSLEENSLDRSSRLHLTCHQHSVSGIDHIREELIEELKVTTDPSEPAKRLLAAIESVCAVAVHIPRNERALSKWQPSGWQPNSNGSLPAIYYQRAIDYLNSHLPVPPVFYFFTDDVGWVKSSLKCPGPHEFVALQEPSKAHEDLRLMQACRGKIISQASISWWAAWLSDCHNCSVVAPSFQADSQPSTEMKTVSDSWIWIDCQNLPSQNRVGRVNNRAA